MRLVLLATLAVGCVFATVGHAQSERESRPNVVLIITDDLGWADLGSYGATDIRTPNLDRLARQGLRLTDFYANGVTCSPTRAGLISGRYQQRYGIEAPLPNANRAGDLGLPATGYSLPQLLENHGYATALIGKWHRLTPRRANAASITFRRRAAITTTTRTTPVTASPIFGKTTNRSRSAATRRIS
jgi:arylsulfatase A-like enzyme